MLSNWKASRKQSPKKNCFQKSSFCAALFVLIICEWVSIAGGGAAIQRSNRVPVANFLALYRKLRIEQLSDDTSAKFYGSLDLRSRRLCGGWNDDSDDHVISLTGADDRLNSRPLAATPHQQFPNQLGVQDVTEKVLHTRSLPCGNETLGIHAVLRPAQPLSPAPASLTAASRPRAPPR